MLQIGSPLNFAQKYQLFETRVLGGFYIKDKDSESCQNGWWRLMSLSHDTNRRARARQLRQGTKTNKQARSPHATAWHRIEAPFVRPKVYISLSLSPSVLECTVQCQPSTSGFAVAISYRILVAASSTLIARVHWALV